MMITRAQRRAAEAESNAANVERDEGGAQEQKVAESDDPVPPPVPVVAEANVEPDLRALRDDWWQVILTEVKSAFSHSTSSVIINKSKLAKKYQKTSWFYPPDQVMAAARSKNSGVSSHTLQLTSNLE